MRLPEIGALLSRLGVSACRSAGLALAAVTLAVPAMAQSPTRLGPAPATARTPLSPRAGAVAPAATPGAPHALTAEDVGGYLDGFLPYAMQTGNVPGAVVVVVKDGRPLFARGYGFADVKAREPIDPARTLFRPGSISKTFTWTAVMQLVQAGKLDLDRDVNAYLDFTIPPAFGRPVTLRALMTHSAGFADTDKDLIVSDPKGAVALRQSLARGIPARIFPPGTTPAYSNWGAGLAGYIVQRISGEPFADYMARHIFAPLGMTHASFQQPLPANLAPDMAKGYMLGTDPPRPYELVAATPAGALAASGDDIGRWMIAHLQDGQLDGRRILDAKTAELMHSPQFRPVPGLPAMAFGFYQEPGGSHRVIGHMGDTDLFHSDMHLFLDDQVGLFISLNGDGRGAASYAIRKALFRGFVDRYFPTPRTDAPTWPSAVHDGRVLSGFYITTRRSDSGWMRIAEYLLGQTRVAAEADGTLTVSSIHGLNGKPKRWREIGPFQYQEIGGDNRLAAVVRDGRPVMLASDDEPPVEALEPAPVLMSAAWNLPLFKLTLVVLAIAAVTWPIGALARWRYRHALAVSGLTAWLYRATRLACVLDLVFLLSWIVLLQKASGDIGVLSSRTDGVIRLIQLVGVLGVVGALFALWNAGSVVADGGRSLWAKLSSVVIALACCATVWFAFSLHLLSWSLNY